MNRPKRGRAPIKKSNNKKFNTLKHERGCKKGKKIKQKNRAQKELRFRDTDSLKVVQTSTQRKEGPHIQTHDPPLHMQTYYFKIFRLEVYLS